MSDRSDERASASPLPDNPSLQWLRKEAKRRQRMLLAARPDAKLADAQLDIARQYGFTSWRALKAHVDSLTIEGQLFEAARTGHVAHLESLLHAHPEKLHARARPYEFTLMHAGTTQLGVVDLLLRRGMDPNVKERGDDTTPMHWAAAGGRLDIVRRLADAGGDVVGHGDDHELEVIGWATCWDGCDDDAHRAVADFLVSRGARHHIFSAIALELEDEVRRIVASDPAALNRRMSRNELHQLPLHFAVRMKRPRMVALLIQLGADPLAVDAIGQPAAEYPDVPGQDIPAMQAIRRMTLAELDSADRGRRRPRISVMDLAAALCLGDLRTADILWTIDECERGFGDRAETPPRLSRSAILHVMAKRGETDAVRWLLDRGADVNAKWIGWDTKATPLHVAASRGHGDIVRLLLAAGADPEIHDSVHDSDAFGWAEYFGQVDMVRLLREARGAG